MKRLTIFAMLFVLALSVKAQDRNGLQKTVAAYYRSDPFKTSFSDFLKHLVADPDLKDVQRVPKTDTSLFAFHGLFTSFNPFDIKAKRNEIVLQEAPIQYSPGSNDDTIFLYDVVTVVDNTPANKSSLMKAFEKAKRKAGRMFFDANFRESSGKNGAVNGAAYNYFLPFLSFAPVTLLWGTTNDEKELFMGVTIRFKVELNESVLPAPLDRP